MRTLIGKQCSAVGTMGKGKGKVIIGELVYKSMFDEWCVIDKSICETSCSVDPNTILEIDETNEVKMKMIRKNGVTKIINGTVDMSFENIIQEVFAKGFGVTACEIDVNWDNDYNATQSSYIVVFNDHVYYIYMDLVKVSEIKNVEQFNDIVSELKKEQIKFSKQMGADFEAELEI